MSWIERVKTKLSITTGDGKVFNPLWMNAVKTIEYNTTEFDFPEVEGTLVQRRKNRGAKYGLEIAFQGEDHLDVSADFETSAKDPRSWTINHPIYGQIIVQPTSLSLDNSKDNISMITGTVIETIEEDNPRTVADAQSTIISEKDLMDSSFNSAVEYSYRPSSEANLLLFDNTERIFQEGKKVISDDESYNIFVNFYSEANSAVLEATNEPLNAFMKVQNFINSFANLVLTVDTRVSALKSIFDGLSTALTSKSEKITFENNAGLLISALAISAATPLSGNYLNRPQVVTMIDVLYLYYNNYLTTLDSFQDDNNSDPDSYVPDAASQLKLNLVVNFTIASLFTIALGAAQERIVYLTESSNVINLTHKYIGLDQDDVNLEKFVNNNKIGINEFLNVQKGRKIVYYI
jgi:hypothetical protein